MLERRHNVGINSVRIGMKVEGLISTRNCCGSEISRKRPLNDVLELGVGVVRVDETDIKFRVAGGEVEEADIHAPHANVDIAVGANIRPVPVRALREHLDVPGSESRIGPDCVAHDVLRARAALFFGRRGWLGPLPEVGFEWMHAHPPAMSLNLSMNVRSPSSGGRNEGLVDAIQDIRTPHRRIAEYQCNVAQQAVGPEGLRRLVVLAVVVF